jgi:hypothetical protein
MTRASRTIQIPSSVPRYSYVLVQIHFWGIYAKYACLRYGFATAHMLPKKNLRDQSSEDPFAVVQYVWALEWL